VACYTWLMIDFSYTTRGGTPAAPPRVLSRGNFMDQVTGRSEYMKELRQRKRAAAGENRKERSQLSRQWVKQETAMRRQLRLARQQDYQTGTAMNVFEEYDVPLSKVRRDPKLAEKMVRRRFERRKLKARSEMRLAHKKRLSQASKQLRREQMEARRQAGVLAA